MSIFRSSFFTSLVLFTSVLSGCGSGGGSSTDDPGASESGQADPRAVDEPLSDSDTDGTPADQDLCPGTPAGAKVDGNGCSAPQREASAGESGKRTDQPAGAERADDGDVSPNGFAIFTLDPEGAVPVTFRTLASNVKTIENGFALTGTVMIDAPNHEHVTLLEAQVSLERDAARGAGLQSFRGSARLPFPSLGFMKDSRVSDPVYASVGYDLGRNLKDVDAPLKDDRKYLFFTFSAGLAAQLGQMSVSGPVGQSVTMTLDVSDPSFFLRGSLGGLLGPVDEASLGFSLGGHLPFTPSTTWGIAEDAASFDGHLWVGGKVNLNDVKLPVAIGGNTVVDVDPNDDGQTFFTDGADGFQFGSNSQLDVSIEAGLVSFDIPVAQSTIVGRVGASEAWALYSGKVTAGNGWMPAEVPLKHGAQLKVAGHVSTHLEEMYFTAEGDLSFDAGKLGAWTGLELNDLAMARATLDIDRDGVLVTGTASAAFSPYVGLQGNVDLVGYFNGHPGDWFVTLDGRLVVSGVDLSANAHGRLDRDGLQVRGAFRTPLALIDMSGRITRQGVDVRGRAAVTIPIVAGKEVAQWVTDAAVCGYETVTDAAVCGSETVTDGAKCGYNYVKDGTLCGTELVKDATLCGTSYVQSGAECGFNYVQDAAQCGVDVFSDALHCGWSCVSSLFSSCSCSVAKSCNVAAKCHVPNRCEVAASCNVPNTCSVPKSCERVKTCETKVTVPDFDYGTFKGTVEVKIGTSGLEGAVQGDYCATGSSCTTLAGGRVKVSSGKPEACVDVAGVGEVCAPF